MEKPVVPAALSSDVDSGASEVTTQERLFRHCELGQYEEIATLMQSGRRNLFVNCVNSRGETPLHAVRDVRCAELLLDSGGSQAALNRQNGDGETPLMASLRLGNAGLANLYLDNGADIRPPNRHFQSCLHLATRSGMTEVLDRLLNMRQLDPNQHDRTGNAALHYAVTYADKERACSLLDRLLQESQLAVDSEDSLGRTAFALAAQSGNLAACRLLRDRGCDLCHAGANGANALHLSSAVSGIETVPRYLVSDLAFSVDCSDNLGRTALFYAAHHGAEGALAELLALGADPNRTDRLGRSIVHVAAEKGHEACLTRLLAARAQPWQADARGQTPLHLAAASGRREVIKRLLRCERAGHFLESRDADGRTARDLAAATQPPVQSVVELLAQAAKERELRRQQREQQRRSYPRPRSAAAKAREAEASATKKSLEKDNKTAKSEHLGKLEEADPRPMSAAATTQQAENKETDLEEAANEAVEADDFLSDEEKRSSYPRDDVAQQEKEAERQHLDAEQRQASQKREEENTDEGIESGKVGTEKIKPNGEPDGQPQPEPTNSSSLLSTSASSLKRTTDVVGDNATSGGSTSRPSSHLDEELHGDRRAREAEDRKHDPYLTAKPAWITGLPAVKSKQQPRLHRSKKAAPNISALRQRLYMYESTAMLGRALQEERRERMLLRGGAHLPLARLQLQQPQQPQRRATHHRRHPTRPSTAADAERLTDRYRDINQETRHLLDKWKSANDSYGGGFRTGSRPVSGRRSPPPARSPSGDRSGGAVAAANASSSRMPEGRRPERPYRRPQSGSRFLDYFPNNRPDSGGDGGVGGDGGGGGGGGGSNDGGDGRRRRAKLAANKSRVKSRAN